MLRRSTGSRPWVGTSQYRRESARIGRARSAPLRSGARNPDSLRNPSAQRGDRLKIKVLIADDHDIVRAGVKSLLERQDDIEIAGEAADGRQVVRMASELSPSIVVMDIAIPQLNGIDATAQILRQDPDIKVIILSMYADEEFLVRALSAGIKGYLLKDAVQEDLLRAVRAVATGRSFFSPAIAQALAEDYVRQLQNKGLEDSYNLLTEREREIL